MILILSKTSILNLKNFPSLTSKNLLSLASENPSLILKNSSAESERPTTPSDLRTSASRLIEAASGLVAGLRQPDQNQRVEVFVRSYINFHASARQHIGQQLSQNPQLRSEAQEHLEVTRHASIHVLQNLKPSGGDAGHIQVRIFKGI